jgi:hypothetical protein
MPKKVWKVEEFDGGINQRADGRDIEAKELVEAFNVDVSNKGQITMPGDGKSLYETVNAAYTNVSPSMDNISLFSRGLPHSGYGLFSFTHDVNFHLLNGNTTNPQTEVTHISNLHEMNTEFLCVNDGANIHIWTDSTIDANQAGAYWHMNILRLGNAHTYSGAQGAMPTDAAEGYKNKIIYYKTENGLRACDASNRTVFSGIAITANIDVGDNSISHNGGDALAQDTIGNITNLYYASPKLIYPMYIKINSEIMKIVSYGSGTIIVERAKFGTLETYHPSGTNIHYINLPHVLTHINAGFLSKMRYYSTATSFSIPGGNNPNLAHGGGWNTWHPSIQSLEPPTRAWTNDTSNWIPRGLSIYDGKVTGFGDYGSNGANVAFRPRVPESALLSIYESNTADDEDNMVTGTRIEEGDPVNETNTITLTGVDSSGDGINFSGRGMLEGKIVIVSGTTANDGVYEISGIGATQDKLIVFGDFSGSTITDDSYTIRLDSNRISNDLQNKYVFGMSFMYEGGGGVMQESPVAMGAMHGGIIPHAQSIGKSADNWTVGANADATTGDLDATTTVNWIHNSNSYFFDDTEVSSVDFLVYTSGTTDITAGAKYQISVDVELGSEAQLRIYAPGSDNGTNGTIGQDASEANTFVTITQSGTYLFAATAPGSGGDYTSVFVCDGAHIDSGDTGDIRIHYVQVFPYEPTEMSASHALDMRPFEGIPKLFSGFGYNMDIPGEPSDDYSGYRWDSRIAGYKIYMKQVDSASKTLVDEWLLLLKVNVRTGEYINYSNDSLEKFLYGHVDWASGGGNFVNAHISTNKDVSSMVTGTNDQDTGMANFDTMRVIPLDTYESENGYKADTNTAMKYKTAVMAGNRKVYIGNIQVGDKTFPDRMVESPADKPDTFPDDGLHYIDIASGDGEEIVKLEAFGDKLLQFKEKTVYLLQLEDEGLDVVNTWHSAGIKSPSQCTRVSNGVVWVNNYALYHYDGKELRTVTAESFTSESWIINEDKDITTILGYDEYAKKVIILSSNVANHDNGGYVYDLTTNSIVECQNLFDWYSVIASFT